MSNVSLSDLCADYARRIDQLEAEGAALRTQLGNLPNLEKAFEIRGVHICDLEDELAALRKDRERLDWLDSQRKGWDLWLIETGADFVVQCAMNGYFSMSGDFTSPAIREAIDKAIVAEPPSHAVPALSESGRDV